jgi:uncharacterized alpha-E superfamily protein
MDPTLDKKPMLSRVADSLYWMSRYLERAEHTARLIDVYLNLSLEESDAARSRERWARLLGGLHVKDEGEVSVDMSMRALTFDPESQSSIVGCIAAARENARQVREQISTEMWRELNRLYLHVRDVNYDRVLVVEPHDFYLSVRERTHLIQGITDSTMSHGQGWQYIQLGRCIERAAAVAGLLDVHYQVFAHHSNSVAFDDYIEWLGLLKSCTAFEAYTRVYSAEIRPHLVAEFLLLNEEFPHSVRYAADCIQDALDSIAEDTGTRRSTRVNRLAGRLRAALSFDQIDEIIDSGLHKYLQDIQRQCAIIHEAAYATYVAYSIESALQ